MITPPYGTATYRQIAEILRNEIRSGRIQPRHRLPSETTLQQEYGVARLTARAAVDVLRAEGLAELQRGRGVIARERPERGEFTLPPGAVVSSRMPTLEEREEFGIGEGVPMLSVMLPDGSEELLPADRWLLRCPGSGGPVS